MELRISDGAKKDKAGRTAMSQQSLVNTLLSEKQATQPIAQPVNVQPVTEWGSKK